MDEQKEYYILNIAEYTFSVNLTTNTNNVKQRYTCTCIGIFISKLWNYVIGVTNNQSVSVLIGVVSHNSLIYYDFDRNWSKRGGKTIITICTNWFVVLKSEPNTKARPLVT